MNECFYGCHGFTFLSEIPLPLPAAVAAVGFPEWRITRSTSGPPAETVVEWDEPDPDDEKTPWLHTGHSPEGIHMAFPNIAQFLVRPDARRILATAQSGVPESTLGHLFMNQVMPIALADQGHPMLHASAVESSHGAVAFLGRSGTGKTTMATALTLRGRPLVSEDIVRLELGDGEVLCHPCPSPPRLWSDSVDNLLPSRRKTAEPVAHYTSKLRISVSEADTIRFTERPVPLDAIVVLEAATASDENTQIELQAVETPQAFETAVSSLFRLKPQSKAQIRREFGWATTLVTQVPFRRLRYPSDYASLPAVLDLLSHLPERRHLTP